MSEVKQLLLLMDTDKNGKIAKQEFMSFMNVEFGFEVVEAATGEQALEVVGTEGCQMVLLDVEMPPVVPK